MVKSGDERKKLSRGEQVWISSGDIIELIPGHHFFKYVALSAHNNSSSSSNTQKRASNEGREIVHSKQLNQKKPKLLNSSKVIEKHVAGFVKEIDFSMKCFTFWLEFYRLRHKTVDRRRPFAIFMFCTINCH